MALTQVDGGLLSPTNGQFYSMKNRIINGAMVIDQRNAGASVTLGSGGAYTLDRWRFYSAQASKLSLQQNAGSVTPPAGFINYLGLTSLSAYSVLSTDTFTLQQKIEGLNVADLAWGTASAATVTLSFWVRSSLTGTFGGSVYNSAQTRSYPFSYTISSANTWEQKSVTIAGDTSGTWLTTNGTGVELVFSLGAGSTYSGTAGAWAGTFYSSATGATSVVGTNGATFYITGVQLEKGSTATSFDYRPYGTELRLCQRYYCKSFEPTTVPANGATNGGIYTTAIAYATTAAYVSGVYVYPVQMRAVPTVAFYGILGGVNVWDIYKSAAWAASASTNVNLPSSTNLNVTVNSTGLTVTAGNLIAGNFTASAEL